MNFTNDYRERIWDRCYENWASEPGWGDFQFLAKRPEGAVVLLFYRPLRRRFQAVSDALLRDDE
jgi:hypothetical protein